MTPVPPRVAHSDAPTVMEHEQREVERANRTGLQPVVFIHGLWLLPSSWDRWTEVFEEAGYASLSPGWPDDPDTVTAAVLAACGSTSGSSSSAPSTAGSTGEWAE